MVNHTDPVRAHKPCGGCGNADPEKVCVGCLHDFGGTLASAPPSAHVGVEGFDKRFAEMLLGILSDVQDELGFTDEDKLCANGSAEIVAEIRELKRVAALAQQPAAPSGEAVAEVVHADGAPGGVLIKRMSGVGRNIPHGTKLYAAPQQPAAVDEAVALRVLEDYWRVQGHSMVNKYFGQEQVAAMQEILTRALAAQQQGGADHA